MKSHDNFASLYKKLPGEQQNLLKLISIFYEKVSRIALVNCLNKAGFKNKKGKNYSSSDLQASLDFLKKQKLISVDQGGIRCDGEIVELATREAVMDKSFENMAMNVQRIIQTKQPWSMDPYFDTYLLGVRDFRIAVYRGRNYDVIKNILFLLLQKFPHDFWRKHPFELVFLSPFDKELLLTLDAAIIEHVLHHLLTLRFFRLDPVDELYLFLEEYCQRPGNKSEEIIALLALMYVARGEFEKVMTFLKKWKDSPKTYSYYGWLALLEGKTAESLAMYRRGLAMMKQLTGKRNVRYVNIAGVFYLVALLRSSDAADMGEALRYLALVRKEKEQFLLSVYNDIEQTFLLTMGQQKKAYKIDHSLTDEMYGDCFSVLMGHLTLFWQGESLDEDEVKFLVTSQQKADKAGYFWLAKEFAALLVRSGIHSPEIQKSYEKLKKLVVLQDLTQLIEPKEKWEQALSALIDLQGSTQTDAAGQDSRLIWLLDMDNDFGEVVITPKLQKLGKNGVWTKGRVVALRTLAKEVDSMPCLTVQDRDIAATITKRYIPGHSFYSSYKSSVYDFDYSKTFPKLVGHPLLFWENNPAVRLEIVPGAPELHVLKKEHGYEISLHPFLHDETPYVLVKESQTRLKLVSVSADYLRVAEVIGETIKVPEAAKEMVLKAVSAVAPVMTIHSDIGGAGENIQEVQADMKVYVHITPYAEGLKVELLFKPFGDGGSFYRPGSGGRVVLAEIDGKQLQTNRDLEKEKQEADQVISRCQVLGRLEVANYEWIVDEVEDCLELIHDLQTLDDGVVVQWPQGERLKVSRSVSSSQFSMRIKQDNDWFAASGNLQLDDGQVVDMKKLLALNAETESRFVKLDDGRFLALSQEFKRRLDEISSFSEPHGKGVRFNPLAGLALEDFAAEVGELEADKHWKKNIKRFQPIAEPQLPSTLKANLRDYQHDGFSWLASLSAWQVGGCLADDMGLGKTLQALAAILLRAPDGPTLVVAPTSVMMNWQDEAARFAPTLNVIFFGSGDRQQVLDDLQSFDLVICSYGLLQSEGEMLAGVSWQVVVLDEAQAIKNMGTKRSKAAMNLRAEYRIITTGTPIENHLGELWNLFRFINPGLLGSLENFNRKFAVPIERLKDKEARKRLKKLIQPFILRRLKRDVLQELPPRTEITMQVEMSNEEALMYEAQRHLALEKIAGVDEQDGGRPMQILAEITRLRRFCCNPNLVIPEAGLNSSKLKVFGQVVDELLQNNHKALVFSQFVGHLAIISQYLDSKKISYQYLDGSTSVKQRQKAVKSFQAGQGDVFLISLKAGGSGLNLTAADYVIHLDPWWNPAVEDQASDRAHRIGQKRPVTVYRLVVKDTIEEKIVALHKHKRDLADKLLEGTEASGRVSTEELLELLKGV